MLEGVGCLSHHIIVLQGDKGTGGEMWRVVEEDVVVTKKSAERLYYY
jgi:hypothetical protein